MFIHPKNLGLCKSINYNKGIYQLPHSSGTCMDLHHFVPSVCNSSCQKWYIWVHQYIHLKSWEMLVELDQCFSIFLKGVPEMIWVFKGSISKKISFIISSHTKILYTVYPSSYHLVIQHGELANHHIFPNAKSSMVYHLTVCCGFPKQSSILSHFIDGFSHGNRPHLFMGYPHDYGNPHKNHRGTPK